MYGEKRKRKYLSCEIFKDGGEVDRSTSTNTLGVLTGLEKTSDSSDGKLEASLATARNTFLYGGTGADVLSPSSHGRR